MVSGVSLCLCKQAVRMTPISMSWVENVRKDLCGKLTSLKSEGWNSNLPFLFSWEIYLTILVFHVLFHQSPTFTISRPRWRTGESAHATGGPLLTRACTPACYSCKLSCLCISPLLAEVELCMCTLACRSRKSNCLHVLVPIGSRPRPWLGIPVLFIWRKITNVVDQLMYIQNKSWNRAHIVKHHH